MLAAAGGTTAGKGRGRRDERVFFFGNGGSARK